ncbi:MAG: HNH endonuclease [Blastocatellia bacterium]|nr:HNH endonuclease [Blastocatellia bacterium]
MFTNRKVLLLNASYEPLGTVTIPRAVRLVWTHTAEMIELDGDRVLRSIHHSFPCPSVIRLRQYIDVRKRRYAAGGLRFKIFLRDRNRCQYCGLRGTASEFTLDHILPKSRGGQSTPENLCTACIPCNQRKGDRTPDEARMPLLSNPSALWHDLDKMVLRNVAEARPEWRPYLFLGDEAKEEVA